MYILLEIPSKDYKRFTQSLKKVYSAPNLKAAKTAFESFCNEWKQYSGAIGVWERNFVHVEQLYNYGSAIRKIMYTTNAIESINSSLRKVTKKGTFPNEKALFKSLYLRIKELTKKWERGHVSNWSMVLNQLMIDDNFKNRNIIAYIYKDNKNDCLRTFFSKNIYISYECTKSCDFFVKITHIRH